jgi:UDP-N-acetylmuramoylalanine--D-glutamate ligase
MTRIRDGELIGILGLARSGLAAARLALARGAKVYASDVSTSDATKAAAEKVREWGGDAEVGRHDIAKLAGCSRIVLSPGIPPTVPLLRAPELANVPIIAELEFAYGELDGPVVAVTGTNGKTTVTSLTEHCLRAAGLDAVAGGNIGIALSELVLRDPQPEVTVVEVSSFQLARTQDFAPTVGVLTNLAPDHLDWYKTVDDYYADKARMYRNATADSRWVINGEDQPAMDMVGDAPGRRFYFHVATPLEDNQDGGYVTEDGWLAIRIDGTETRVIEKDDLQIRGPHNLANSLAATLSAVLVGAEVGGVASGLRSFAPLDHRLEPVVEKNGVLWVNDSKATNIASTRVAIQSMDRPTTLLLGGRHKGEEYTKLIELMPGKIRRVIAYGEAGEQIEQALGGAVPVERVQGSFSEVLAHAAAGARPGEAVLLSPACSSYDMFKDYEDRGRQFRRIVREELS